MTDASGDLKTFGEVGRKKHDKKVAEFRYFTTMVRSGSSFGSNGLTEIIIKEKNRRNGYNKRFIGKHGSSPGSTIAVIENAFMTEKAWYDIFEKVCMCLCCFLFTFL